MSKRGQAVTGSQGPHLELSMAKALLCNCSLSWQREERSSAAAVLPAQISQHSLRGSLQWSFNFAAI